MNAILIFQFLFKDTKPVGTKTKRKKGKKKGKERTINRRSLSHNVINIIGVHCTAHAQCTVFSYSYTFITIFKNISCITDIFFLPIKTIFNALIKAKSK